MNLKKKKVFFHTEFSPNFQNMLDFLGGVKNLAKNQNKCSKRIDSVNLLAVVNHILFEEYFLFHFFENLIVS